MTAEAQNLKVISAAIDWHTHTCGEPLVEIRMSPFEVERLDWPEVRGVPIVADPAIPTGVFRLVCSGAHGSGEEAVAETVEQREPIYV